MKLILFIVIWVITFSIIINIINLLLNNKLPSKLIIINSIGTCIFLLICLLAKFTNNEYFIDIAFIYVMSSFIALIGLAKFLKFNNK